MTPLASEAHVPTPDAAPYLEALCRQFEQRAREHPQRAICVTFAAPEATIELGWARCTLRADETGLTLRAEGDDQDALEQVCELVARHLETHADKPVAVAWSHLGSSDSTEHRRDRMRAFHARGRAS
jgi:hypothetical protein